MKKKISELMEEIEFEKLDTQDIEAYELTNLEIERIHKKVVAEYKQKSVYKKKSMRFRVLLVAAVMALGSTTAFALAGGSLFESIFKENEKNLGDSGQVIDLAAEDQNIRVSIKGVVGYSKRLVLLLEAEKLDGTEFEGNTVGLHGYLDLEGQGQKARYFIDASKSDLVLNECTENKKVYKVDILNSDEKNEVGFENEQGKFEVKDYGTVSDFIDKKANFVIEEITEEYNSTDVPDTDLAGYIDGLAEEESIPFDYNKYEFSSGTVDSNHNHDIQDPKKMLSYKKIGVPLYEMKSRILLDNIGFIEGKLHIRLYGKLEEGEDSKVLTAVADEGYSLGIEHTKFLTFNNYDESEKSKCVESYYIFDIKDMDELQHKALQAGIYKTLKDTKVLLQIPFELNVQDDPIVIKTEKYVNTSKEDIKWKISQVELSNVALDINMESVNSDTLQPKSNCYEDKCRVSEHIKLQLVDGTEVVCKGRSYGAWDYDAEHPDDSQFNIHIFFINAIDVSKVESVIIDGEKIAVRS